MFIKESHSIANFYIYRNLHKNCFSIKHKNKVIDYSNCLLIYNPEFRVNEKGRQRVIKEKRKNVHAYILTKKYINCNNLEEVNYVLNNNKLKIEDLKEIYYNPYTTKYFILKENNKRIKKAYLILAFNNKIYLINP